MLTLEKKREIILNYLRGIPIRHIARELNCSKNTVKKYVREYEELTEKLKKVNSIKEKDKVIEHLISTPKYKIRTRNTRKLNNQIKGEIDLLLEENCFKRNNGMRKQQLKGIDIYEILSGKGIISVIQRYKGI